MATGNYGIVRPADVDNQDIQIFYNYTSSRQGVGGSMTELDSESLISDVNGGINSTISGIKNLNLPADIFGSTGIYNILVRPRENNISIIDCGVLSVSPDVKGILFNVSDLPTELASDNSLIGFRVEYFNLETGIKEKNLFRIITSSGRVEPVNQNLNNTNQKAIRYRYNDAGSLVFCTLTPTSTAITLPNQVPFIGAPNQQVTLTNTYFDPIHIELEMVEHDSQTLSYALYGNQSKSIQDGIYTIYDNRNRIYKQYNLFEIQDDNNNPLYEARSVRSNIDENKSFNNIFNV